MKVALVTQARLASSRLPNKILLSVGAHSALQLHLRRLKKCKSVDQFILATTLEPGVEEIIKVAQAEGFDFFQGSIDDVLERFYLSVKLSRPETIVRVTSDCPLIDPKIIDEIISRHLKAGVDYSSNTLNPTLPDGMDCEVFSFAALEKAYSEAKLKSEREHVTPYIWKNSDIKGGTLFKALSVEFPEHAQDLRMTLDHPEDLNLIRKLVELVGVDADWKTYAEALKKINVTSGFARNEGYFKSTKADES